MKTIFIIAGLFISFFIGCAASNRITIADDVEVVEAGFKHWSQAPPVQSDVRERGTDLELIIKNWPEGAEPGYIVFRGMKSFPAEITDTTESGMKITARIIRSSAVMSEISESVDVSDRLVFTGSDEKTYYVEIGEWGRMEE